MYIIFLFSELMCLTVLFVLFPRLVDRVYPNHNSIDDYIGVMKAKLAEQQQPVRNWPGHSAMSFTFDVILST